MLISLQGANWAAPQPLKRVVESIYQLHLIFAFYSVCQGWTL